MGDTFEIYYANHERNARKIILESGLESVEKLALMASEDIEKIININFICFNCGGDWLLIPNEKSTEFSDIVKCCKS